MKTMFFVCEIFVLCESNCIVKGINFSHNIYQEIMRTVIYTALKNYNTKIRYEIFPLLSW